MNTENIINGLNDITGFIAGRLGFEQAKNFLRTIDDAISILKKQEAVEPIPPTNESDLWKCGNCNHQLFRCTHQKYCEMCGREVKWE